LEETAEIPVPYPAPAEPAGTPDEAAAAEQQEFHAAVDPLAGSAAPEEPAVAPLAMTPAATAATEEPAQTELLSFAATETQPDSTVAGMEATPAAEAQEPAEPETAEPETAVSIALEAAGAEPAAAQIGRAPVEDVEEPAQGQISAGAGPEIAGPAPSVAQAAASVAAEVAVPPADEVEQPAAIAGADPEFEAAFQEIFGEPAAAAPPRQGAYPEDGSFEALFGLEPPPAAETREADFDEAEFAAAFGVVRESEPAGSPAEEAATHAAPAALEEAAQAGTDEEEIAEPAAVEALEPAPEVEEWVVAEDTAAADLVAEDTGTAAAAEPGEPEAAAGEPEPPAPEPEPHYAEASLGLAAGAGIAALATALTSEAEPIPAGFAPAAAEPRDIQSPAAAQLAPAAEASAVALAEPETEARPAAAPAPQSDPEPGPPYAPLRIGATTRFEIPMADVPFMILAQDPQPEFTLPGPQLTTALQRFQDLSIITVIGRNAKKARPSSGIPGWLVGMLVALILALAAVALLFQKPAEQPTFTAVASPAATPAAFPSATSPLAKYVQVTGVRFLTETEGRNELQYLVVNHSSAEIADFTVHITLRAPRNDTPICSFSVKIARLGPFEAKELATALQGLPKPFRAPDWRELRTEVDFTQP
jgi:hypothetical protein